MGPQSSGASHLKCRQRFLLSMLRPRMVLRFAAEACCAPAVGITRQPSPRSTKPLSSACAVPDGLCNDSRGPPLSENKNTGF